VVTRIEAKSRGVAMPFVTNDTRSGRCHPRHAPDGQLVDTHDLLTGTNETGMGGPDPSIPTVGSGGGYASPCSHKLQRKQALPWHRERSETPERIA
jgi:hypothetical protein